MTMSTKSPSGHNENRDPFVVTPPRKHSPAKTNLATTPSTPQSKSKSTPLHKRFLEEVRMSPGTPATPPRTPSRSPQSGQAVARQTLEVGQNGFYFSMEIPGKKVTPRKTGWVTPSPEKKEKETSEVKGTGRVRDILRKNLFGSPTKKATPVRGNVCDDRETKSTGLNIGSPGVKPQVAGARRGSSGCEESAKPALIVRGQQSGAKEVTPERANAPTTPMSHTFPQHSAQPPQVPTPSTTANSTRPARADHAPMAYPSTPATANLFSTASNPDLKRATAASTPSNIGQLMAGLSNKSTKVQTLPTADGLEPMPTPLRKMSERLGLKSPHIIKRGIDPASTDHTEKLRAPISALDLRAAAVVQDAPVTISPMVAACKSTSFLANGTDGRLQEFAPTQFMGSPIAVTSSVAHSRPSTATTVSFAAPSTPRRPGAPSRSQSYGTPARLRTSIQEDMFKVQESLKKSLGPGVSASTKTVRSGSTESAATKMTQPSLTTAKQSESSVKKIVKPVSMVEPAKSPELSTLHAVPRRPLNTAARKPRPKSMIVGSAKVLETIASNVDSPRERAKLRSAASTPSSNRTGPTTSRPGTAASISRKPVTTTTTTQPASKVQPTIRTTKSAILRAAAHPKRAANIPPGGQRVVSAEAIAERIATWNSETRKQAASKPPIRNKSIKSPTKQPHSRPIKPPKSTDPKADSGFAQSYTPPGSPTRLPSPIKSPSRTRLTVPTTPAPTRTALAANPPKLRKPLPPKTPANRRVDLRDPNAIRTPSKEIESSLDRAIDAKIAEDARSGKVFTPSGNRISQLLDARKDC